MKLHWSLAVLASSVVALSGLSPAAAQERPGKKAGGKAAKQVTNSLGMKLAFVPAGVFTMGSPATEPGRRDDETQHEVEITRPYHIGVHEVTQREYFEIMGENPLYSDKKLHPEKADCPAECVSWDDAMAFCKKLSERPAERKAGRTYRLPTEAEWEYACRGGPGVKSEPYHFGATISPRQANFNAAFGLGDDIANRVHAVKGGAYPPNALGLFDMHGNVYEWCLDLYAEDYYKHSPRKDPQGADSGGMYVMRGGNCQSPDTAVRSATRHRALSSTYGSAGFRVVLVAR